MSVGITGYVYLTISVGATIAVDYEIDDFFYLTNGMHAYSNLRILKYSLNVTQGFNIGI